MSVIFYPQQIIVTFIFIFLSGSAFALSDHVKIDTRDVFYDICVQEMVAGMKEGIHEEAKKGGVNLLEDLNVLSSMKRMAHSVCDCAAPKYRKVVLASLYGPAEQQTQEYYEKEAVKIMMNCM